MKYLIKFTIKRDVRLLLRYNYKLDISKSSLYRIADFYYILLQTTLPLNFPTNLKVQVISQNTVNPQEKSLESIYPPLTDEENYLFNWAMSEILQAVKYIEFEQNSVLTANSRVINYHGSLIYRCFDNLVDAFAILNYTPDSFSDSGRFNQIDSALAQIEHLYNAGARVIDLGVQSTRAGAMVRDASEEIKLLKQILPAILELKSNLKFELSIDTYHSETVLWLVDFAIDIINDVSGSLSLDVVKSILKANKRYVAMHSLCIPADPKIVLDTSINPIDHLYNWFIDKVETIASSGCDISNLILDPGIGFGLTAAQSWFVIHNISKLYKLPCELLLGHSRKSFFSHITSKISSKRDLESAIVAANVLPYVDYVRLHELELFNLVNPVFNQMG